MFGFIAKKALGYAGKALTGWKGQALGKGVSAIASDAFQKKRQQLAGNDFDSKLAQEKKRLDTLFPNTTPLERLGGSTGASSQISSGADSAAQQAMLQAQLVKLQGMNQRDVAEIQADAQRDVANIQQNTGQLAQAQIRELQSKYGLQQSQIRQINMLTPAQVDKLNKEVEKYSEDIKSVQQQIKTAKSQKALNEANRRKAQIEANMTYSRELRGWANTVIQGVGLFKLPGVMKTIKQNLFGQGKGFNSDGFKGGKIKDIGKTNKALSIEIN